MGERENTCLSGAQRLPVTHCFYTTLSSIAEPISHLEMEPSIKREGEFLLQQFWGLINKRDTGGGWPG